MVSAGALRSPVPLPGWLRFNIKPSYDCAPLGSGATAVNGIKGRSCTRSALPGRRGGSGNINITPICYAQHTRVFSSARVYEPLEPGVSTTAWPLTATSPTVRKHGVATGASRRAATTQHAHESIPDASATTAFAYTTEQQQNPEDPRAGPGVPAPGPTRRRRRRNSSQEEGPRASAQHADDVASSYPGAPYLPSAPQQQRGASFANGSGGRRHAQPVSTLSHGDFSAEAGWPGTWEAPPPLPPPPPAPPAGFPAPVAVAAPPAGSVMAGWALMGDQSRMNGVYRWASDDVGGRLLIWGCVCARVYLCRLQGRHGVARPCMGGLQAVRRVSSTFTAPQTRARVCAVKLVDFLTCMLASPKKPCRCWAELAYVHVRQLAAG